MARHSKPLSELDFQPKRRSKHSSTKQFDSTESNTIKSRFKQQKQTRCARCQKSDQIAKPYLNTFGSVHPRCHDEIVAERNQDEVLRQQEDREAYNEEQAKKLGYPMCIICERYADLGNKIYVYSDSEIVDGHFEGSVHRSCFEKLQSIKT